MTSLFPDSGWLKALELPAKIFAGLFLFFAILLIFDLLAILTLSDFGPLARPIAIVGCLLFGSMFLAAIGGVVSDFLAQRHRTTLLSSRREIRRNEAKRYQGEFETRVLKRLDYLSADEVAHVAECLRKNERSFKAWADSPDIANLRAAGLVGTPGGTHNQDYYPFYFFDFAWETLLKRRDEFIKKDDERKRTEAMSRKGPR